MDIALLKQQVYEANMELFRRNMIIYTWGNVSGIDRERGIVVKIHSAKRKVYRRSAPAKMGKHRPHIAQKCAQRLDRRRQLLCKKHTSGNHRQAYV